MRRTAFFTAALAAVAITVGHGAKADSVSDFYQGKTVTVVSPSNPGGSIYNYALLISNHIGRHIPGKPTAIAEARSGGGGIKAANYMAKNAPKDGTVIAELHPSSLIAPMIKKASYDPRKFHWLGSAVVRTYVGAVWHASPAKTLEEMRTTPIVFGGSGRGSASFQNPTFMAHISGAKIKVVTGYKSGGATNLALERGEVQGRGNYYSAFLSTNPDWIREKKVVFAFKMGPDHPDLKDVPDAGVYAKTDSQKKMLRVLEAPLHVGQAFYLPPGVPAERVVAVRRAFANMLNDPVFIAAAKKQNLVINPRTGDQVLKVIADVYTTPKPVMAALDKVLGSTKKKK